MPKVEVEFSDVMHILSNKLKSDPELYFNWQSNIAMAFVDASSSHSNPDNYKLVHKAANDGAKHFLNVLCNTEKNNRVFLRKPRVVLKDENL